MFRSATFKLTLWYLAIVMVISLVFSVGLYQVTSGELDRGLHRESQRISRQFPIFVNDPRVMPPARDLQDSTHHLLLQLVLINSLIFIGAGFTSYWLARRTLQPIEAAHEQQKRFTADVSHELRTPLTALKMESEVALMNSASSAPELRATLKSNLEEVAKLELLINNLLRLTRLEADELQQSFTDLDLQSVVKAAVKQLEPLTIERGIAITTKLMKLPVHGDADNITQVLVILLDNALKYSQTGQTITVSGSVANNQAVIKVVDQGIGIEPDALAHIFDRFYRADSSRNKASSEGYGLGLSIAKLIIDIHRGSIELSSRKDHGTTATLRLPLVSKQ